MAPQQRAPQKSGGTNHNKRPANDSSPSSATSLSVPPAKRKQSVISKQTVAAFFTPASQKPKDRILWSERSPNGSDTPATLLVGQPSGPEGLDTSRPQSTRKKVAAFDLDSTLITTASGKKFANDPADWAWWHPTVPTRLGQLYRDEGYHIVIFSNQAGITLHVDPQSKAPKHATKDRIAKFKQKCSAILTSLDIPVTLYAATGRDVFRKPHVGMWQEMLRDYGLTSADLDLATSFLVGDAAGRPAFPVDGGKSKPKDFSCSDRNMAHNLGIRFHTPDAFFLGEEERAFARDIDLTLHPFRSPDSEGQVAFTAQAKQEVIVLCGPPGAGKSTFHWAHLDSLGFERINQDILKSKPKCLQAASDAIKKGRSITIDNTNPDPDTRALWVRLAKEHELPIRCVWFKTPLALCEHNDAARSFNTSLNPEARKILPKLAFNSFASRFQPPKREEGFVDIVEVDFHFRGTKEQYETWTRYYI